MEKLLIQRIAGLAFVVVLALAIGAAIFVRSRERKLERRISAIESRKLKIVVSDSVASAIESRILDSLKVRVDRQDAKIAELSKVVTITRRKNESLEKRINDLNISMPDF